MVPSVAGRERAVAAAGAVAVPVTACAHPAMPSRASIPTHPASVIDRAPFVSAVMSLAAATDAPNHPWGSSTTFRDRCGCGAGQSPARDDLAENSDLR